MNQNPNNKPKLTQKQPARDGLFAGGGEEKPQSFILPGVVMPFSSIGEMVPTAKGSDRTAYVLQMLIPNSAMPRLKDVVAAVQRMAAANSFKLPAPGVTGNPFRPPEHKYRTAPAGVDLGGFCFFVRATTKLQPPLIDAEGNPVAADLFYPGCRVRADVSPWFYNQEQRGIKLTLNALQFVCHGRRIAGGGGMSQESAVQSFGAVEFSAEELEEMEKSMQDGLGDGGDSGGGDDPMQQMFGDEG